MDASRKPTYFYNTPDEILNSLTVYLDEGPRDDQTVESSSDEDPESSSAEDDDNPNQATATPPEAKVLACSRCAITFTSPDEQKSHLRSDWHQHNLKRTLRGRPTVSELEHDKGIHTLSDSDPSDQDPLPQTQPSSASSPLIWLSSPLLPPSHCFTFYRDLLDPADLKDVVAALKAHQLTPIDPPKANGEAVPHVFLCMVGGGHFAAMVVGLPERRGSDGGVVVLAHRTIHRYTTRRKQGGAQSANDRSKGPAHSAGASLRRYNEQAMVEDVQAVLREWKRLIDTAQLLIVRATGPTNKAMLFSSAEASKKLIASTSEGGGSGSGGGGGGGGGSSSILLSRLDPRLRRFPFTTGRPTQRELTRAWVELTRLRVREAPATHEAESKPTPQPAVSTKKTVEEREKEEHTGRVRLIIGNDQAAELLAYFAEHSLGPDFGFTPRGEHEGTPTPLHYAAARGSLACLEALLEAGGDPTTHNRDGRVPFELARGDKTRDVFVRARASLGEECWDWTAARVAAVKTEEDIRREREEKARRVARKAKELEQERQRRRDEEARLKAEEESEKEGKAVKMGPLRRELALRSAQEKLEADTRGMSEEAKRRLERERRARAAEQRMRLGQGQRQGQGQGQG